MHAAALILLFDIIIAKPLQFVYMMRREILYPFVLLSVLCGACSTEGIYYVRPADVSTCPGQPCHNLSYYSENSQLFFTSNTTLYFLPGEHILEHVIVTDVSNITLVGMVSAEHTILHCPGEGGVVFIDCKKVYLVHLTFSNCGADYGTSISRGLHFQCVTDLEISNIVVTNSTGIGLYAMNVVGSVHIQNSVFTYNTGNIGGNAAFVYDDDSNKCPQVTDTLLRVENSVFAYGEIWSTELSFSGGIALVVYQSSYNINMIVRSTTLHGNQAVYSGGNMFIGITHNTNKGVCNHISVSIQCCNITQGEAEDGGGLYVCVLHSNITGVEPYQCDARELQHTLYITDVNFVNNTALHGGNIYIMDDSGNMMIYYITNSSITGGKAQQGGGMYVWTKAPAHHCTERKRKDTPTTRISEKRLTIWKCDIQSNVATDSGGGLIIAISGFNYISTQSSYDIGILVTNTTLHENKAASVGGNMMIYYSNGICNLSIEHCYMTQGEAENGGGLYVQDSTTTDEPCQCGTGEPQHTLHITDVHFVNNTAHNKGGSIHIWDDSSVCNHINISNSSIIGGKALFGGGLSIQMGKAEATARTKRKWNDSEYCNTHTTRISVKRWTIRNCDTQNNFATYSGGGLCITVFEFNYSAIVDIIDVRFSGNNVHPGDSQGSGHVSIEDIVGRGGMVLVTFRKVYFGYGIIALGVASYSADVYSVRQIELWKCLFEEKANLSPSIKLYSLSPHINPATSSLRIIFRNVTFINTPIQILKLSNVSFINSTFCDSSTISSLSAIASEVRFQGNIVFKNNTGYNGGALALFGGSRMILMPQTAVVFTGNHATHAGGALMVYDESLHVTDHCFYSNHEIEDTRLIFENNTAEYAGDVIFGGYIHHCLQPVLEVSHDGVNTNYYWFQEVQNFSSLFDIRQEGLSVISSQPYRACLCENDMPNCYRTELTKYLYPGGTIAVSAVVVGRMNGTVPGVVYADFVDSRQSSLSRFQTFQGTERVCTTLRYTIYSNARLASLRLRAENTSRISGYIVDMTEPHVSIRFLSCPPGFALGNSGERQLGKCDCHPVLFKLEMNISCNITDQTVYRPSSLWIGWLPQANTSDVIYQHCPFDYCKLKPANTKLNESDQQCNFNRSGTLCGACSTTYSLMLGASLCSKCNELYPLPVLLVAFAIVGVLLVAFLTLCNLTVSEGTINGLIFYANIVHTNRSIFFPSERSLTAPFAIFIAWLNLDFGFKVCFLRGMDTYSKTWLQFVFPAYIWLIAFLMIVSSHYSTTAAKLIGRNAVKVLATLFLLSFAKLQQTIIAALSFTFLNFLDGSRKKVWVYDGNIDYLEGRHIPLFLAGLLAFIFLLLPYTLVLTFIQHLRRRTGIRMLFWVRRLKPFFDAYTGPYKDKYSLWVGLLLLVRSSLFLVFTFNALGDPSVNLLATSLTGLLLAVVLQGLGGVYKKWPLNILESLSFLNLSVLSQATLYVRNAGGNQTAVVCISAGIAFLTFVAILFYHMTFTRVWRRLMEWYSQRKRRGETREIAEMETMGEQAVQPPVRTVELQFDQYREPFLADVTS